MKKSQIVRAWRDPEYLDSLTEAERALIPAHPAGPMEVEDEVLNSITGGCGGPKDCTGTDPNNFTAYGSTILCTPCPGCECAA